MRKQWSLALAAAMACGGIGYVATSSWAADDMNDNAAAQPNANAANDNAAMPEKTAAMAKENAMPSPKLPMGVKAVETPKKDDMTETLKEATQAMVTKDAFNDLVERFVDQDRNRLGKQKSDENMDKLNGRVAQIQKAYKDKYGKDFDIDQKGQVFARARVVEGEITDPAALMRQWPVEAAPAEPGAARTAKAEITNKAGSDETEDNANLEKGREVGVVRLQSEAGLPAVDISMIDEAGSWKIDVPNNRSYTQIRDDLLTNLTYLGDHQDQWPADATQAQRLFTHHMAMAVYGVPMPAPKGS
jgi:hypothetical protein